MPASGKSGDLVLTKCLFSFELSLKIVSLLFIYIYIYIYIINETKGVRARSIEEVIEIEKLKLILNNETKVQNKKLRVTENSQQYLKLAKIFESSFNLRVLLI